MEGQLNEIPGSILAIPQMLMVIFDSWDIGNSSIIFDHRRNFIYGARHMLYYMNCGSASGSHSCGLQIHSDSTRQKFQRHTLRRSRAEAATNQEQLS
jgi:hypothetical protein